MDTQDRYGITHGMEISFERLEKLFKTGGRIAKKKGVKNARVSLNERMAVVEYDPAIMMVSDIAKTVNDLGYIATARR